MSQESHRQWTGIVRGQTIVLDAPIDLPDGTPVVVEIRPRAKSGELSDEDRAILEHVYQERGCGVERDC